MLSCPSGVRLSVTPWTVACQASWDSPGKNTGVGCPAFLQGIFPTQGSKPNILTLPHCRRILHRRNTDIISYPKHHCSQFPALIGIPSSSIAFSCNYNKIQSCFFIFLGPGEMGPHLITHSPLQYQGRLLSAPQIPWHHGHHSVPLQPSSFLPQVFCIAISSAALILQGISQITGSFSSLRWTFPDHFFFKLSWYLLSQNSVHNLYSMFPSRSYEYSLSLLFPLDCQLQSRGQTFSVSLTSVPSVFEFQ